MYLIRRVASRKQGMQLKLMKFHALLHIVDDILLYGVPLEADTSSNEEHHKPMKKASRLTQRAPKTFNLQTGCHACCCPRTHGIFTDNLASYSG